MKKILSVIIAVFSVVFCQAQEPSKNAKGSVEQSLVIIKPEAVADRHIGAIVERFEKAGIQVVGAKMVRLTKEQAGQFYISLKDRPFYSQLTDYMSSGPIFVVVFQGINAIERDREIIGATDPKKAKAGTVRADFGTNIERNAVHGSDSADSAKREISFFFIPSEIFTSVNSAQ
jgi:nucleoside-diphosphate kinase